MTKLRILLTTTLTLMILVLGSGFAQALPVSPKWLPVRPNW